MLKYYGLEEKREKIKEWYDGYKFGIKDIYNPWSVLKCVKDMYIENLEPQAYWANTSGNDIVKKIIKNADNVTKNEIETLINGGTIEKTLNSNITYNEIDENKENIWSMLFFTGYLTYTKESREEDEIVSYYELKIPNNELLFIYKVVVRNWFEEKVKEKDWRDIILQPSRMKQPAIIIEIKVTKDIDEIETKCEEAITQIENKQYET